MRLQLERSLGLSNRSFQRLLAAGGRGSCDGRCLSLRCQGLGFRLPRGSCLALQLLQLRPALVCFPFVLSNLGDRTKIQIRLL